MLQRVGRGAAGSLLVVAALPVASGKASTLLADTGYFSQANVEACVAAGIDPMLTRARQSHDQILDERFATAPPPPNTPTPVEAITHRPETPQAGRFTACASRCPSRSSGS